MKANCWYGKQQVRVEDVPDPQILNAHDAIVRITSTAICGSDLHLYNGFIPAMEKGDILGHEFMGEVVEVGREVRDVKVGDRVVVPFPIACGTCFFCQRQLFSLCENTNPNAWMAEKMWGHSPCGIYGYSHMLGGYAGGQAEYARVPFADVGALKIPDGVPDEQVLFLSDIFPTGYMGAENCDIEPGDTIAVWGCGPVGQFAIKIGEKVEAASITPAAKPSMTSWALGEIRITGRNTGRAATPVAAPAARLARKPIQISESSTSTSGSIFPSSTAVPDKRLPRVFMPRSRRRDRQRDQLALPRSTGGGGPPERPDAGQRAPAQSGWRSSQSITRSALSFGGKTG
jgi:hypothetical protein